MLGFIMLARSIRSGLRSLRLWPRRNGDTVTVEKIACDHTKTMGVVLAFANHHEAANLAATALSTFVATGQFLPETSRALATETREFEDGRVLHLPTLELGTAGGGQFSGFLIVNADDQKPLGLWRPDQAGRARHAYICQKAIFPFTFKTKVG